jgi:hypothetical protein
MMKEDGCTLWFGSDLGLDPADISILPFVHHVKPLGVGISKNQEILFGVSDLNRGVVHAHRLRCDFVTANNAGEAFSQQFLDFNHGHGRNHFPLVIIVMPLARDFALLIAEDLFFAFVDDGGNGGVHVGGNFLDMIEVTACLDIQFGAVALMFFDGQDEVGLREPLP